MSHHSIWSQFFFTLVRPHLECVHIFCQSTLRFTHLITYNIVLVWIQCEHIFVRVTSLGWIDLVWGSILKVDFPSTVKRRVLIQSQEFFSNLNNLGLSSYFHTMQVFDQDTWNFLRKFLYLRLLHLRTWEIRRLLYLSRINMCFNFVIYSFVCCT